MNFAKKTQYNIKVDIHEVKDLSFRESANEKEIIPNPYVQVTVNNENKCTPKKNQAVNVAYNTSFNFSMDLTDYLFQRTSVDVCVLHKYTIQSALIGKCSFGLNYVYSKPQHWLYRIWVRLRNPDLPLDEVGFLLISVGVYGPGDAIPIINDSVKTNIGDSVNAVNTGGLGIGDNSGTAAGEGGGGGEEGEDNVEFGGNRGLDIHITHYDLSVNIFRGQDMDFIGSSMLFSNTLEPYVKVTHNGFEESTKVIRNDPNPVWNISVHIPTCTPCYDKNIIIELVNGEHNGVVMLSILLDLFEILKRELHPRWYNIYYNPQNQIAPRSSIYNQNVTANAPNITNTSNAQTSSNAIGNYLFSATAEKLFKNATQGININEILGVTKMQNMFSYDDNLKEFYLYGGRIFLSVNATKTHAPGPIRIKSARVEPDPPNKEFIFCADIYEILSVRSNHNKRGNYNSENLQKAYNKTYDGNGENIICVCGLGPHKLKTCALLPNDVGSYVLNENTGRINEFRIFLPQNNTDQIYDIFLYIYVKSNLAVADWITTRRSVYNTAGGVHNNRDLYNTGDANNGMKLNHMGSINKQSEDIFNESDIMSNYKLSSYVRIPFKYLLLSENKPKWFSMKNVDTSAHDYSISFYANLVPFHLFKKRQERLEYKLSRYFFRALIYEGLHFPAKGYDSFPDPYIKIELAGQTIKTSTILHTLNPNYYEAYEVEVILPTNLNLAPDISIEAFSVNKTFLYNDDDILLGSCTYPIIKVPIEWKRSPVWISLKSSQYKKCKAKLLVGFELVPLERVLDDSYPFYDDIRPSTLPGHVSLFLVGIRMFKPLKNPSVTVCFGRDVDDTSQFLWHETVSKVISGKEGNWNFLKYFSLDVALPKRMQHHSFLEVRVEDRELSSAFTTTGGNSSKSAKATNNNNLIGTAYITLNPLLPWLDKYEKNECVELFKLHLLEEVLMEDAERARKSYNTALVHKKSSMVLRKNTNILFDGEGGVEGGGSDDEGDGEGGPGGGGFHALSLNVLEEGVSEDGASEAGETKANDEVVTETAIHLGGEDFQSEVGEETIRRGNPPEETEEGGESASVKNSILKNSNGKNPDKSAHHLSKKKKKNMKKFINKEYVPYNDPDFANVRIEEALEHVCFKTSEYASDSDVSAEENEHGENESNGSQRRIKFRDINFFKGKNHDDEKEKNVQVNKKKERKTIHGFSEDALNFQLSIAGDDEQEETQRDEMLYEYEVDMNVDDLPYLRATIFRCTDSGIPEAVGYLKYLCNVYDDKTIHLKKEMLKKCEKLVNDYKITRNLVVRAYIIQARGLNPPSGATDITTYVWIKNSNEITNIPGGLSHNIKDTGHIKRQGYKPEFNRSYQLLCSFPDESIIQVCIMNQGSLSDEIIGYTYIDMEDRYFNPRIRQLMMDDNMPIELRSLKLENSTISHGSLRCWFEIFTEEFAQRNPVKILCSNEPDDYQLRVVIWKVNNVAMDESPTISLFVRCIYTDEDLEDKRDTDTHYNSKDGKAVFNWRFVYNVKIPTNATNVKVQVHNYGLLSSSEPIGEATLNLATHFYRARKKRGLYHIPRFWLQCKHPAHKNRVRGSVEVEACILPKAEAEVDPVGNGRDEPNKDPFLPPVTENRTYVDWVTINEKFGAATASIMHGLKWTGVWIVVAVVVVGVFFLLILLK
ncbi:ferlin, putative [Plasmodium knowlesi strain H]|uniref:Ferlin, putative n=3 Tax=Plasmodium knowlesi TaxID=5850 RepID=A0A5E7WTU0_PLAKH|nr:ferlin-like protein, putative [Plasmodium knowlesi strain H]OTN68641.1 putative Ferlin [Plasmodium knowlesi]CAA9986207.1 ferlin-like protein, putative [Plasmodium knowlesi strain H]SBO25412.1 ferlin, putative [Plasmodium knowlesi strain H]SBO27699.1 ferlin, putative [Plasmodium knowlesi strain H]VVS75681.1 ferlin-like protein, putative [Plasmodium knowlesi strain H]